MECIQATSSEWRGNLNTFFFTIYGFNTFKLPILQVYCLVSMTWWDVTIMKSTGLILLFYAFILHHLLHSHISADKSIIDKSFTFRAEIFLYRFFMPGKCCLIFWRLLISFITKERGLSFLHWIYHAKKLWCLKRSFYDSQPFETELSIRQSPDRNCCFPPVLLKWTCQRPGI